MASTLARTDTDPRARVLGSPQQPTLKQGSQGRDGHRAPGAGLAHRVPLLLQRITESITD